MCQSISTNGRPVTRMKEVWSLKQRRTCLYVFKKTFFFPPGTNLDKVKEWSLKKMATQFKGYKTKLHREFVKKGLTPDWNKMGFLKLKPYWNEFVEFKLPEDSMAKSKQNTVNASQNEYNHRLGIGGYKSAIRRWDKMEQDHDC
ncbi:unnamed protein product [Urochloa humidicola]